MPGISQNKTDYGELAYVVFDPKTIEILRKYGLLGATYGGGSLLGDKQDNQ